jgi:uncharacterized protein
MKQFLLKTLRGVVIIYVIICTLLFFFQEKLIFFPQKLGKDHKFHFDQKFVETTIQTADGTRLSGLLFKADIAKGLVFYLHGNAGSLASWGDVARTYTDLSYDVFMLDYRGFGKSEGGISGQAELYEDLQTVYDTLNNLYPENKIVVLGYSIGSGPAAKIASENNPRMLVLQAPYYSLTDMMRHTYPIIPTFILKYKFETNEYIQKCKMPVIIFHGNQDEVIYYESSLKLQRHFKKEDTLITLRGQRHNGMAENEQYKAAVKRLLLPMAPYDITD